MVVRPSAGAGVFEGEGTAGDDVRPAARCIHLPCVRHAFFVLITWLVNAVHHQALPYRVMHGRNLRPVRGVPVPPLFGLGVPYLHFSGEKVDNLLSTEAILIIIFIMLVYYAMTNRNAVQIKY